MAIDGLSNPQAITGLCCPIGDGHTVVIDVGPPLHQKGGYWHCGELFVNLFCVPAPHEFNVRKGAMNKEGRLPSVCTTAETIATNFMQLMRVHKWTSMGRGDDMCRLPCQHRRGVPRAPVSQSINGSRKAHIEISLLILVP